MTDDSTTEPAADPDAGATGTPGTDGAGRTADDRTDGERTGESRPAHGPGDDDPDASGDDDPDADLSDRVEAALRRVRDPELDLDVFEAGLVENVVVEDASATIHADLSEFGPGDADAVASTMLRAASDAPGVDSVHVEHAGGSVGSRGGEADDDGSPSLDGDAAGPADATDAGQPGGVGTATTGVAGVETVIAVASAKGGVGKTTVAATLACALAGEGGRDVGAFDADVHGPNLPAVLSASGPVYSDDDGNPLPVTKRGLEVMSVGLMEEGTALAWRGAMAHDALTELYEDTAWSTDRDTLVVDLPPGTGDVALTTVQEVDVDGVVFVTTPFHAAVTDTARSLSLFRENDVPILGVVANMAGYVCDACGEAHDLFPGGEPMADRFDVPVLGELPFDEAFQGTPAPGAVPPAAVTLAERVEERLAAVADVPVPDGAVDLRGVAPTDRREVVAEAFADVDAGESFVLVSDRDPTPVLGFLADRLGVSGPPGRVFDGPDVVQLAPRTWRLSVTRPGD